MSLVLLFGTHTANAQDKISHIGTTSIWDKDGQRLTIERPADSSEGDLLILALHRTDDLLPYYLPGWTRAAECFKEDNGYDCVSLKDCTDWVKPFCKHFKVKLHGRDLAQVIFYKTIVAGEPSSYTFNLNEDDIGYAGWAILSAFRGANNEDPVRDWSSRGCDLLADSLFPSVSGKSGDLLLLSQSFDDAVPQRKFKAPQGTSDYGYVSNSDEAGFLFGGILTKDGETGNLKTRGDGASRCKDALISLTIKPKQG